MLATLPDCCVLCLYSSPDAEMIPVLLQWLEEKQERYIIIFEQSEALLLRPGFHERVRFCFAHNEEAMRCLAWEFVFLHVDFFLYPENSLAENQMAKSIFNKMFKISEEIHLQASSYKERGLDGLKNVLKNWPVLLKARQGADLYGKFTNVPAIICGAGISLEKEITQLKSLENQALIFAGGTALCAFSAFGLTPHFVAAIDPHPMGKRFEKHALQNVPLFFQGRIQPQQLQQMGQQLLWIPSNCMDPAETWLCKELKSAHLAQETGWNVSTFLVAIAHAMGCNPIVFVGMDFVEESGKSYAGGIQREEIGSLVKVSGQEDVWTRRDWIQAADWLSSWIKKYPDRRWINTSFQGLEIQGVEKKALKDLSFPKQKDLKSFVFNNVQDTNKLVKNEEWFVQKKEQLLSSFVKVGVCCEKMLVLLEKIFPHSPERNGEYALLEIEIESELAYQDFLLPVWEVWKHVFARKVPQDIPETYALGLNRWLFIKGICDETRSV